MLPASSAKGRTPSHDHVPPPREFVDRWRFNTRTEHSASQEHLSDLCRVVGHPSPAEADPTGEWFTFEAGANKALGGDGFADV